MNFNYSKTTWKFLIILTILSILSTLVLEGYICLLENPYLFDTITSLKTILILFSLFSPYHVLIFFISSLILFRIVLDTSLKNKASFLIYKYRFLIAIFVFIVGVFFEIHGSSINELNIWNLNHHPLLGISRNIRSDEYIVNTLFAFSQYPNGFAYFSEIVRATTTDMFIIYGQPVLDVVALFNPFQLGYLFLNPGRGLSFFWLSRLITLFLVSFEMGMLLTNRNKKLALAYTFLITFSPTIQWWFAVNGLVEQLIFGQIGVLLINMYMTTKNYKKRLLIGLFILICVGGFILVFYPSWQIPFSYVFLLLACWVFLKNYKEFYFTKKDIVIFLICFLIFSILMLHILNNSLDTIKIILQTVYPANEVHIEKGHSFYFLNYVGSIFYPLSQNSIILNVVECSTFFDFFPIPLILFGIVVFLQKTKDKLLLALVGLYIFFTIFYLFPLPDILGKITLLSSVKLSRLFITIGFLGILILIRSISSLKAIINKKAVIIVSFITAILVVFLSNLTFEEYYVKWMIIVMVLILTISYSFIFLSANKKAQTGFLICCILISCATGALVNPVDSGASVVYDSPFIKEVSNIVDKDPNANWIVQDMPINLLLPVGAHTINSVNVYPDLERWHLLDVNNISETVYNRYAHIIINLQNESNTSFVLVSPDSFIVNLNINDLKTLNVSYITTTSDLNKLSNNDLSFEKIYQYEKYKIYKVVYL